MNFLIALTLLLVCACGLLVARIRGLAPKLGIPSTFIVVSMATTVFVIPDPLAGPRGPQGLPGPQGPPGNPGNEGPGGMPPEVSATLANVERRLRNLESATTREARWLSLGEWTTTERAGTSTFVIGLDQAANVLLTFQALEGIGVPETLWVSVPEIDMEHGLDKSDFSSGVASLTLKLGEGRNYLTVRTDGKIRVRASLTD